MVVKAMNKRKEIFEKNMKIGQLAKQTGESSQTIRYYESIGLVSKADRNISGYRVYDTKAVNILRFIQRAKEAGFTLKEIKTLINLADGKISRCKDVRPFVEKKVMRIKNQLKQLKKIEKGLTELLEICRTSEAFDTCPILEKLVNEPSQERNKNEY